ncbi:MAG: pyridoxamine 5'-phosphate oxidase [Sporichthyaceae bacterium]
MRAEYRRGGLDVGDLPDDPMDLVARWFDDVVAAGVIEPNACVLGTVGAGGVPASRTVLAKGIDSQGFVFYTNYTSAKAAEIAAHPVVTLLFPWYLIERQLRVIGRAVRVSPAESEAYFRSRPRDSQLGAWASFQSSVVADRDVFEGRYAELNARWPAGTDVPVPDFWGGYRVEPDELEFWQGRTSRLHDRLRFSRAGESWTLQRLAP